MGIRVNWLLCLPNCCQGATMFLWCYSYSKVEVGVSRARVTGLRGWSRRKSVLMGDLGLVVSRTLQVEASTRVT